MIRVLFYWEENLRIKKITKKYEKQKSTKKK